MPPPRRKHAAADRKSAKLRPWRVSLLRQRVQYLGTVQAPPDERSSKRAAIGTSFYPV